MSFISKAAQACGAIALAAALSSAQAAVVDFTQAAEGGVYTNPTGSGNGPSLYVAQGFEFLAVGPDGHFHENLSDSSSVYLHSNYGNVTTNRWVLSMSGGGAFDVSNFTLTQGALNWLTDTGVVGTVGTGSNALSLTSIHSLTFLLVSNGAAANVTRFTANASSVPEPTGLALALAALGGMGLVLRRRKQA